MEQSDELIHGENEVGAISDINVTPFIDVMLVLLIIFMVTAPLMMGGVKINLPKTGGEPAEKPERPLVVSLDAEHKIWIDQAEVPFRERFSIFRDYALASESGEVFVRGDGEVKYSRMMELMSELGQAGFARVTLVTGVQASILEGGAEGEGGSSPEAAPSEGGGAAPAAPPADSPAA
jgi:biopolymer transport protein TolR